MFQPDRFRTAPPEIITQKTPDALHLAQNRNRTGQDLPVAVVDFVMKRADASQRILWPGPARDFAGQEGIAHGRSADHPGALLRKPPAQLGKAVQVQNVSVVDEFVPAQSGNGGESVQIDLAFVQLHADTGVEENALQRIAVEHGQQAQDFPRFLVTQAQLDRPAQRAQRANLLQNPLDPVRKRQQARSMALSGHTEMWATQVPVQFPVAHAGQHPGRLDHPVGVGAQQLRNQADAPVLFGHEVAKMQFSDPGGAGGGDERGQGGVETGKVAEIGAAENPVGQTVQGSQVENHCRTSLRTISLYYAETTALTRACRLPQHTGPMIRFIVSATE